ncbi:MAG TPA: lytic transglycosylase domain-containing protein [Nocardioidaceae bacterium]|nr:lytic transglycosylase domain-containing protein [Nocardioidaceae bacterium]
MPELRRPTAFTAAGGVLAAAAVAGTVVVVTGDEDTPTTEASRSSNAIDYQRAAPDDDVSRDLDRETLADLKAQAMEGYSSTADPSDGHVTVTREELATSDATPQDIALAMLPEYGWDSSQFSCLDDLWYGESQWDPFAENPYSGAYGIPQALPGYKMASAGPDWETNPATQIEWGLGYIQDRYGSPCAANDFKLSNGWY